MFQRKPKRYVARDLNWRPILGVKTGIIDDTQPDEPSTIDHSGPGFDFVTTYSSAKRIARWANRREGK